MKVFIIFIYFISLLSYSNLKNDIINATKLISDNNIDKAREIFLEITTKNPKNVDDKEAIEMAKIHLGNIFLAEGDILSAKKYFLDVSNDEASKTSYAIASDQKLILIFQSENNNELIIKQLEKLNKRIKYTDLYFLSNLIYMYENNSYNDKLNDLTKNVVNKLSEKDKGKLYDLIAYLYLDSGLIDKANFYYEKLLKSKMLDNILLGHLGFANTYSINNEKEKVLKNISYVLQFSKNNIVILEKIKNIYQKIGEYEKAYDVLKKINKINLGNPNVLIDLLKYTIYLDKKNDAIEYIKSLDELEINDFNLGMRLSFENLVEYSEIYLLRAKEKKDLRANEALINMYFATLQEEKLINLLNELIKEKLINVDRKNKILNELEDFKEYIKNKERVGVN